jgi:hypothetical protein
MDPVRLHFAPGTGWVWLRELSGGDERGAVRGTVTADALELLDRLLADARNTSVRPVRAANLSAGDRDRLLATVYMRTYGTRISNTLRCAECGALYDIDFSLDDLVGHRVPAAEDGTVGRSATQRLEDGSFQLPDGTRFRLPTGEDECATLGLPPVEAEQLLLDRCLVERGAEDQSSDGKLMARLQEALEALAPTLDVELDTVCAECGAHHPAGFDIEHYLLSALLEERPQLARDIHLLASTYGWSLSEILDLPRSQRRSLVALVEAERSLGRSELS